ncbi:MAG: hemagglutinin [Bacteroidetes bacterium]|nr:hemagglutinin [Bacteroidota bacterium]
MNKFLISIISLIFFSQTFLAQNRSESYLNYIEKYSNLAVEQQKRYKIPASITLAQGLLESAAGMSELSRTSNNHFGIKCHNEWEGEKVFHKDDHADPECFRKYKEVSESYEDHSLFLSNRRHYAFLFDLNPTDYKEWAYGLKKAGYASDPAYPVKLIKIIEDYDLHRYDLGGKANYLYSRTEKAVRMHETIKPKASAGITDHDLFRNNKVICIFAHTGDSFESLAREFNIPEKKLLQYNDLSESTDIVPGTIIYLKAKKKKAAAGFLQHVVKEGENMYRISQKYGIRLEMLYKLNSMPYSEGAETGMILKLR